MGDHSEEEIRQRKLTAYCTQKDKENSNQEEKPDLEVKKEQKKCTKYFTIYLPRKLVYLSVLVVVIASVIIYVPRTYFLPEDESPYTTLGQEGAALFRRYDRNGDDHLSVSEYEALYHQLVGKGLNISEIEYIPEQKIQEGDEMLTLRAYFKPLLIETMTKDMAENFFGQMESLTGLKEWTTANQESLNFGVQHFSVFFPVGAIEVGQIYELFTDGRSSFMSSISSSHLSSNRFYPTKAEDKLIVIQRILSMFHPRPFLVSRFPPKGGVALVRAVGEEYIDIVFRIHAEFQLNEPPFNPFWFTPGQFTGNLIVTKDYSHIVYFNVYVPNDKKLNVDMEWLNGPSENENMEVDIGYMPLMQANISAPSREWRFPSEAETPVDIDNSVLDIVQNIQWSYEISEKEALRLLEVKMYPFKQVKYYNFTETLTKAKEENKLIHSILLWGALDDQSC